MPGIGDRLFTAWLKLQEDELWEICITIFEVIARFDQDDEEVRKRVESPEYLRLVKKCFRECSAAESKKRRWLIRNIRNLLSKAAATKICTDNVVSMFIRSIEPFLG